MNNINANISTGAKTEGQFTIDYQRNGYGAIIPIIDGVEQYTGAVLSSPDLRAGAALVIAALAADDYSEIRDIKFIERGYEDFPEKLRKIGAHIEKIDTDEDKRKFMFRVG